MFSASHMLYLEATTAFYNLASQTHWIKIRTHCNVYVFVYVFFVLIWRVIVLYKNIHSNENQLTKFKSSLRINKLESYQTFFNYNLIIWKITIGVKAHLVYSFVPLWIWSCVRVNCEKKKQFFWFRFRGL